MEFERHNGTLHVSGVRELSALNARFFRDEVCARLAPGLERIEIDFSETHLVDSCGLGALVSLYKATSGPTGPRRVVVRLLQPRPPIQQVFELTRMHHLFEVVLPQDQPPAGSGPT